MMRVRKAYSYTIGVDETFSDTVYAPNYRAAAGIVRDRFLETTELLFRDFLEMRHRIHRDPAMDVTLPDRHPLAETLSAEDLHTVTHAYGGTGPKAGYRDHFFTGADDARLMHLVSLGLFERGKVLDSRSYPNGSAYFYLTDLGKSVAAGEQLLYDPWVIKRHEARLARAAKRRAKAA